MQRLVDEEDLSGGGGGGGQSQSNGGSAESQSQWSAGDAAAASDRQSQSAAAPTAVALSVFTPGAGPHSPSATAGSSAAHGPGPSHGHGHSGAGPVAAVGGFATAPQQSQQSQPPQSQSFGAPGPARAAQFRWFLHLPVLSDGPALVVHSENPDVRGGSVVQSLGGRRILTAGDLRSALQWHQDAAQSAQRSVDALVLDPAVGVPLRCALFKDGGLRRSVQTQWLRWLERHFPAHQSDDSVLRVDELAFVRGLHAGERGHGWMDSTSKEDLLRALENGRLRVEHALDRQRQAAIAHKQVHAQTPNGAAAGGLPTPLLAALGNGAAPPPFLSNSSDDNLSVRVIFVRDGAKGCMLLTACGLEAAATPTAAAQIAAGLLLHFPAFCFRVSLQALGWTSAPLACAALDNQALSAMAGGRAGEALEKAAMGAEGVRGPASLSFSPASSPSASSFSSPSPLNQWGGGATGGETATATASPRLRLLACSSHPHLVSSGVCGDCRATLCWRCIHPPDGDATSLCAECLDARKHSRRKNRRQAQTDSLRLLLLMLLGVVVLAAVGLIMFLAPSTANSTVSTIALVLLALAYAGVSSLLIPSARNYWDNFHAKKPDDDEIKTWAWSKDIGWPSA